MPTQAVVEIIKEELSEIAKTLSDKILLGTIVATTSITTAQAADVIPVTTMDISTWLPTDYGLAISMIAGVILILERIQTITYKAIDRRREKKSTTTAKR